MHDIENKYVRVSDISSYTICPRLAYFRFRKECDTEPLATIRSEVCREISRSLGTVFLSGNPQETLAYAVRRACADMAIIYGYSADEAIAETKGLVGGIIAGMEREAGRLGRDRLAALLHPEAERVSLYSDKLRMSGRIDRICKLDGRQTPVSVSVSAPPENGVYQSDRIRLAAYSLLFSDRYDYDTTLCAMEYMGGWCIREVEIKKADMREALSVRRRIEEGRTVMPDARRGKWCERCAYKGLCVARVSFMDSLFRRV